MEVSNLSKFREIRNFNPLTQEEVELLREAALATIEDLGSTRLSITYPVFYIGFHGGLPETQSLQYWYQRYRENLDALHELKESGVAPQKQRILKRISDSGKVVHPSLLDLVSSFDTLPVYLDFYNAFEDHRLVGNIKNMIKEVEKDSAYVEFDPNFEQALFPTYAAFFQAFAQPFETNDITMKLPNHVSLVGAREVLIHEMTHVRQFFKWDPEKLIDLVVSIFGSVNKTFRSRGGLEKSHIEQIGYYLQQRLVRYRSVGPFQKKRLFNKIAQSKVVDFEKWKQMLSILQELEAYLIQGQYISTRSGQDKKIHQRFIAGSPKLFGDTPLEDLRRSFPFKLNVSNGLVDKAIWRFKDENQALSILRELSNP